MKDALNIFRGQARTGIGDGPQISIPQGEQYLWSDAALWTEEFAEEAGIWMSLDERAGDRGKVGDGMQAWSSCCIRGYHLTAMLIPCENYNHRLAYFAHGRAWPLADFKDGFDPGAFLGRTETFSRPWRDSERTFGNTELGPAMVWPGLVKEHSVAASTLLASLLQACRGGPAVAWLAPLAAFTEGSFIHGLVSFARAALPYSLKQQCRIRVFTGDPAQFLIKGRANLIVIPEDLRMEAQTAYRQLVVVDRHGALLAGQIDAKYQTYANAVIHRSPKFPDAIFEFSVRADSLRDPNAAIIAYDLAYAGSARQMDAVIASFLQLASSRETNYRWGDLITNQDWALCSASGLEKCALTDAVTPDSLALRRCIRQALFEVKKQQLSGEAVEDFLESIAAGKQVWEILELRATSLLDLNVASNLFLRLSHVQVLEVFERRGFDQIAELTGVCKIPGQWIEELPKSVEAKDFQTLIEKGAAGWREALLGSLWITVQDTGKVVPSELANAFARQAVPSSLLEDWIAAAEMLRRAGLRNDSLLEKVWRVSGFEQRNQVIDFATEPWAICLHGAIPPDSWDADVRDPILANADIVQALPVERLALLTKSITSDWPEHIQRRFTEDMRRNAGPAASALVSNGIWMKWRCGIESGERPPSAWAWAWMKASLPGRSKSNTQIIEPKLEEWTQVMLDLPQIDAEELLSMWGRGKKEWPFIPMFQAEQEVDLVTRGQHDYGILFELAQSFDEQGYERIARITRSVQPDWLRQLADSPPTSHLSLEDAETLESHTLHRKIEAKRAVRNAILGSVTTRPEALQFARQKGYWDQEFLNSLGSLLNNSSRFNDRALEWLDKELIGQRVDKVDRKSAQSYLDRRYRNIAEFLSPGVTRPPVADVLLDSVVAGQIRSEHDWAWKELGESVSRRDIISQLRNKIREVSPWGVEEQNRAWRMFSVAPIKIVGWTPYLADAILRGFSTAEIGIAVSSRELGRFRLGEAFWRDLIKGLNETKSSSDRLDDSLLRISQYLVDKDAAPEDVEAFFKARRGFVSAEEISI